MARLPEPIDLGRRQAPQSSRAIATVSNAGAVGRAAARLGDTAFQAVDRYATQQADYALAEAKSRYLRQGLEVEESVRETDEWNKWGDSYGEKTTALRGQIGQGLSGTRSNKEFDLWAADVDTRNQMRIRADMAAKRVDAGRASLSSTVNANVDAAVLAGDAAFREDVLTVTLQSIDGARDEGWISAEDAVSLKRKTASDFATRRLSTMEPEARLAELDGGTLAKFLPPDVIEVHRQKARADIEAKREGEAVAIGRQMGAAAAAQSEAMASGDPYKVAAAITVGIESGGDPNAKNPNSTATGSAQFIDATWLEITRRNRPDLIAGKSDAEILAMRTDPKLSLEMAEAYGRQNGAYLQSKGIEPTAANIYLAHFMGPGGAAKALAADPDAPISSVMSADEIAANAAIGGGDFALFTVADLTAWAADKVGAPAVSAMDSVRAIQNPTQRAAAMAELSRHQAMQAAAAEQQRAQREQLAFSFINTAGKSVLDLPMDVQNNLGREAMSSLLSYEQKVASGQKPETDQVFYTSLMERYATHPEGFKAMDPLNWRGKLSDADYQAMVERRTKLMQGEKPDVSPREASAILTQSSALLAAAGIDTASGASPADKKTVAEFQREMLNADAVFIADKGRRMTPGEFNARARDLLTEVVIDPSGPFNKVKSTVVSLDEAGGSLEAMTGSGFALGDVDYAADEVAQHVAELTVRIGRAPSAEEVVRFFQYKAAKGL